MGVPTQGEEFARLIEYIRKAQEAAAMLSHLAHANDDKKIAMGWFAVSENFKRTIKLVTELAQGRLQ